MIFIRLWWQIEKSRKKVNSLYTITYSYNFFVLNQLEIFIQQIMANKVTKAEQVSAHSIEYTFMGI